MTKIIWTNKHKLRWYLNFYSWRYQYNLEYVVEVFESKWKNWSCGHCGTKLEPKTGDVKCSCYDDKDTND